MFGLVSKNKYSKFETEMVAAQVKYAEEIEQLKVEVRNLKAENKDLINKIQKLEAEKEGSKS